MRRLVAAAVAVMALGQPALCEPDSLADAYRILTSKRWVDLTHSFSPQTPVWEGFGPATFSRAADPASNAPYTLEKDGFQATYYAMVGQYGTHVDPPAHFSAAGATLDEIPVRQMILPLVVFDITGQLAADPNHALSLADIQAWEERHGRVPPGAFVALRTDMWRDFETNPQRFKRHPFPAWSLEALRFLYEQRAAVANGHEALDTDTTDKMESETYVLSHGHFQIECLAHLDEVPATGALLVVTWAKPRKGLGFPARAFAILP